MSKKPAKKVPSDGNNLDLTNATRGVWLVKVPHYIARKWNKAESDMEVGKIRIVTNPGRKFDVTMTLSQDAAEQGTDEEIPTEHKLKISALSHQLLGVFSQEDNEDEQPSTSSKHRTDAANWPQNAEGTQMVGTIIQKMECMPITDNHFMKLRTDSMRKASAPQCKLKTIDKIVHNYKPVKEHVHNIEYRERKKAEAQKPRNEKNVVMDMLFKAFEKHQYYNISHLVKITKQPIAYLKQILNEICDYNKKNPHKHMWELKKEYRHYTSDERKDKEKSPSDNDSD